MELKTYTLTVGIQQRMQKLYKIITLKIKNDKKNNFTRQLFRLVLVVMKLH